MRPKNKAAKPFLVIILVLIVMSVYSSYTEKRLPNQNMMLQSMNFKCNLTIDLMRQIVVEQSEKQSDSDFRLPLRPLGLYDLINLFTPDQNLDYSLYDWKTEANNSAINWLTHGVEMGEHEFYREGETVVSVNGKVIQCLDKKTYPCKWGIVLSGVRNGYTSFEISSVQSQELEKMEITELFKGRKFEAKLLKTDEFDNKTYRVKFPQKKPIDMSVQWSCGSAGCSLTIKCETLD